MFNFMDLVQRYISDNRNRVLSDPILFNQRLNSSEPLRGSQSKHIPSRVCPRDPALAKRLSTKLYLPQFIRLQYSLFFSRSET